jgi:hypothetical protein
MALASTIGFLFGTLNCQRLCHYRSVRRFYAEKILIQPADLIYGLKFLAVFASAQTGSRARTTMCRMFNRRNGWWQLWTILAVVWTLVVVMSGWINLPRARHIAHDPQFLNKLSIEASSVLRGNVAQAKPARGAIVWSETSRIVRMSNGAALTFPATTTSERAEFVASEYRQLLSVEARTQTLPYLLKMLAIWLAPLVVAGAAISLIGRGYKFARSVTGNRMAGDTAAYGVTRADPPVRMSF